MTTEEPQFDRSDVIDVRRRFKGFLDAGSRFIALVVRDSEDGNFELIYVFDQDEKMTDFRFAIPVDQEVDSVADIYPGAMTAEREAVDLFGVRFKGVRPGLFLVEGKSPPEPLRKRQADVKGGDVPG
ncbi:MAG: NADH-quinone oxidoreductase subunit C [Methanomassiliicoccus sp.]|nr:NADH-quinone oxidoreductase subunit C [Methanomassiliicoccus sp.]